MANNRSLECLYHVRPRPTGRHSNEDGVVPATTLANGRSDGTENLETDLPLNKQLISSKGNKAMQQTKSSLLSKWYGDKVIFMGSTWTLLSRSHTVHRNQFGMDCVCKHKRQNYKSSENHVNGGLYGFGVGIYSPDRSSETIIIEEITDELAFISILKSLPEDMIKKMKSKVHIGNKCS